MKALSAHTLTVLFLYIVSVCTPLFFPEQGHAQNGAEKNQITVGSKAFTEGYILAEIVAQVLEVTGETKVVRKFGIGGTGLLYEALVNGSIDVYPEYSGTISEAILKDSGTKTLETMRASLNQINLVLSEPLGFNNTYALALPRKLSQEKNLVKLSDIQHNKDLRAGLSHEFMKRADGYGPLSKRYGFELRDVKALSHTLAYKGVEEGKIDLIDVYSTDAQIKSLDLVALKDDREFFPRYMALFLARSEMSRKFPESWAALKRLAGTIDENEMIRLNAAVDLEKKEIPEVVREFLALKSYTQKRNSQGAILRKVSREEFMNQAWQHFQLVSIAAALAILLGLPLGVLSARFPKVGQTILLGSGLLQTIPSLALLCFLIPVLGIGKIPALVALFLYALMPIVISAHTGIKNIDRRLIESAKSLGLTKRQVWFYIELPLSARNILAGVKTSVITSVGTATLAALIGAGGFGVPIMTGLALNDTQLILAGAIPAALMAVGGHFFFYFLERVLIPRF